MQNCAPPRQGSQHPKQIKGRESRYFHLVFPNKVMYKQTKSQT